MTNSFLCFDQQISNVHRMRYAGLEAIERRRGTAGDLSTAGIAFLSRLFGAAGGLHLSNNPAPLLRRSFCGGANNATCDVSFNVEAITDAATQADKPRTGPAYTKPFQRSFTEVQ